MCWTPRAERGLGQQDQPPTEAVLIGACAATEAHTLRRLNEPGSLILSDFRSRTTTNSEPGKQRGVRQMGLNLWGKMQMLAAQALTALADVLLDASMALLLRAGRQQIAWRKGREAMR